MEIFYQWASEQRAHRYAKEIQKLCPHCQAMEHPHHVLDFKLHPTPVPPVLMDSVSVDIFNMPPVKFEGVTYDCFVACVYRLSGWIIAIPLSRKGLTAQVVGKEINHRAWLRVTRVRNLRRRGEGSCANASVYARHSHTLTIVKQMVGLR